MISTCGGRLKNNRGFFQHEFRIWCNCSFANYVIRKLELRKIQYIQQCYFINTIQVSFFVQCFTFYCRRMVKFHTKTLYIFFDYTYYKHILIFRCSLKIM